MRMKRSLLVKAGEALAPDAFSLVLDSESSTKGNMSSSVVNQATLKNDKMWSLYKIDLIARPTYSSCANKTIIVTDQKMVLTAN